MTALRPGEPLASHPPSLELFRLSDSYHTSFLIKPDEDLEDVLTRQRQAGLPNIGVSPSQGKILHLLTKTMNAKRILEVGTLGGYVSIGLVRSAYITEECRYSTIWLAKAIPEDGEIITLEVSEKHAEVRLVQGETYHID